MQIRIGTRRSDLARWQANHVAELIKKVAPHAKVSIYQIGSVGDRDRKSGFQTIGGIGVFTKESEEALLRGDCDLVVHSLKDLPTTLTTGLCLASVPRREDPRDCLCGISLENLRSGIRIGTGSIRRQAQLLSICPELIIKPIRGNVPPRLRKAKLKEGIDGTLLAAAGLKRLGIFDSSSEILDPKIFPYAVGQGALGIETRLEDKALIKIVRLFEDKHSRAEVDAERSLMRSLEAGCSLPIGVHSYWESTSILRVFAQVTKPDGTEKIAYEASGIMEDAESIGEDIGLSLLRLGAENILSSFKLIATDVMKSA